MLHSMLLSGQLGVHLGSLLRLVLSYSCLLCSLSLLTLLCCPVCPSLATPAFQLSDCLLSGAVTSSHPRQCRLHAKGTAWRRMSSSQAATAVRGWHCAQFMLVESWCMKPLPADVSIDNRLRTADSAQQQQEQYLVTHADQTINTILLLVGECSKGK